MAARITKDEDISFPKYLFHQGKNFKSYEIMGVHKAGSRKSDGYVFRVWAPRAEKVALVGDFNGWDVEASPMERMPDDRSIWQITVKGISEDSFYKYVITTDKGELLYKADPYAFMTEKGTTDEGSLMASMVHNLDGNYKWTDGEWCNKRAHSDHIKSAMNIYEIHFGSWRRKDDGSFYSYREMAKLLIPYVKKMGYTHIEIMPLMEYPYEASWGYQITGYYSITSRYGTPEDFMYFVNEAHVNDIGIILDWVPAHFPKDAHGLMEFDGYPLYEDSDELRMEHKSWGTRVFDHGRPEVQSFLISNAFFYFEKYHIDGIRVDAVAAMLYLDYDRPDGEWRPNDEGGRENKEAVHFLQTLNKNVLSEFPGALMIAEESTAWPLVTMPPDVGGLGFNFKWNMGWMNDVLEYFSKDPYFRSGIHEKLTFPLVYAFSENYILPISHDEVVHGKCSLLSKMPGEYEEKFAGLRMFITYMMSHPGKKLLFMGCEFGQFIEWNEKQQLDWMLLDYEKHRKLHEYVKDINKLYNDNPAFWQCDDSWDGFQWIDANNANDNVLSFLRKDEGGGIMAVILNMSGQKYKDFYVGVPEAGEYKVLVDSDKKRYGGSGTRRKTGYMPVEGEMHGFSHHISIDLPPLSGIILQRVPKTAKKKTVSAKTSKK